MILDKIIAQKVKVVDEEKGIISQNKIISLLKDSRETLDFKKTIKDKKGLSIIAEVKKASPSKGVIREDFNPVEIAKIYHKSRVEAISVLTEEDFFQGSKEYLCQIREKIHTPLLRKDFIVDPYQIYQSKVLGADVILLIVAALDKEKLSLFQRIAKELGLQCLVEIHNIEELKIALDTGADIIGINNRNLKTFETSLETTAKLIDKIPREKTIISESGINNRKDMQYLESLEVDGVLIGESLMRTDSIEKKIRELRGEMS